ncbi:MAG: peptide chain release factor 3 [Eubacteriales bacterium]|nr:peptide chain release factor 3 [Eubacteriales bacterium]
MNETLLKEVNRRRVFAIISHPDAGKTTLTEKLLLYGGAIREAGSVKARKSQRHATSDWMEIEKQRGISVTSSAMQFSYGGYHINILDTPGHQDFSEDTYRVLVAADAAVMLIDGARGVEAQTIKLFKVCAMRGIPIFTFVNKMDRASKDPFALMDELEDVLKIKAVAMNWPIGVDGDFKGIFDRETQSVQLFFSGDHGATKAKKTEFSIDDPAINSVLDKHYINRLMDEKELLDVAGYPFDLEQVKKGKLTPMYFGSAVSNFGVEDFLESFLKLTSPPSPRESDEGDISPYKEDFSGFIFKIQANMNPAHRDRIAFMRVVSGEFKKDMQVQHMRLEKQVQLKAPQQFMADEREIVEKAYPGDIIGLFDPGIYLLGDTLIQGKDRFNFPPIPVFAPEFFARVKPVDSMKRKQFIKGMTQLSQEGAIQVFFRNETGFEETLCGVVGMLQFDVLSFRLQSEYNVDLQLDNLPYKFIRWVEETPVPIENLQLTSTCARAKDSRENDVLLFQNEWSIRLATENNKGLVLHELPSQSNMLY